MSESMSEQAARPAGHEYVVVDGLGGWWLGEVSAEYPEPSPIGRIDDILAASTVDDSIIVQLQAALEQRTVQLDEARAVLGAVAALADDNEWDDILVQHEPRHIIRQDGGDQEWFECTGCDFTTDHDSEDHHEDAYLFTRHIVALLVTDLRAVLAPMSGAVAKHEQEVPPPSSVDLHGLIETVKATGSAVEILGVKIEPCDEYGRTLAERIAADEQSPDAMEVTHAGADALTEGPTETVTYDSFGAPIVRMGGEGA